MALDIANANFHTDISKLLEDLNAGRVVTDQTSKQHVVENPREIGGEGSEGNSDEEKPIVNIDSDGLRSSFQRMKMARDQHRRGVSMDPDGLRSSAVYLRTNTCT